MEKYNNPNYNPIPSAPPYILPISPPSYCDIITNNNDLNKNNVNNDNNTYTNSKNIENQINIKKNKIFKKRNAKNEFRKYSGMKLADFNANERKELLDYGRYLGVNLHKYPFCLEYVLDSINAPLPKNWEQYIDDEYNIYYYCRTIDKSSWEHPADPFYKEVVKSEIKKYKKEKKRNNSCVVM